MELYIDKDGNRYTVVEEPWGWFVLQTHGFQENRFKEITGSRSKELVTKRFNDYAKKQNWLAYPDVICTDCATRAGKTWPEGHLGTFTVMPCDVCGEIVPVTEPRDWKHFNTTEELKALYAIARLGEEVTS